MAIGQSQAGVRDLTQGVVDEINLAGSADLLLVCEHASNFIPEQYGDLGLDAEQRVSHIAWDPGALPVALALSARFDAALIAQRVSRLVYDCNRPPEADSAIPAVSEIHAIPGNANLPEAERRARVETVYEPFRAALAGFLDSRVAAGRRPAVVTIHSFTPVYCGRRRDVEIGILHDRDARLADAILARAAAGAPYALRRNEPYGPQDGVTHTLREHAVARGLPNVMIEIRNDLLAGAPGQQDIAQWLWSNIGEALAALSGAGTGGA